MRYIVAILPALALALPIASPAGDAIRLSEPVEVTDTHEVFGAPVGRLADATPLAEIIAASERHDGREVRATARVSQVCQKKGCFFIAQDGDAVARVTFADYGFFVPTDSGGKDVTIVGIFRPQGPERGAGAPLRRGRRPGSGTRLRAARGILDRRHGGGGSDILTRWG
jgi:hypothetical protein